MTIIQAGFAWDPPAGMSSLVKASWSSFYRAAYRNFGLTPAQYRALYLAQRGRCYICRKAKGVHPDDPMGRGGRRLGIDHNHALGDTLQAVRGLLCTGGDRTCNRIIGWLTRDALERGAYYLARPPAPQVFQALQCGATDDELVDVLGIG